MKSARKWFRQAFDLVSHFLVPAVLAAAFTGCVCDPLGVDARLFHCDTDADCGAGSACAADGVCHGADFDAGAPDAGPAFTQENCGSLPPLSCVAFSYTDAGASYGLSALAAIDGGFLAAIERNGPHRIEVATVDGQGFSQPLASWPLAIGRVTGLSVAAQGDAWAVAWVFAPTGSAVNISCASGQSLAQIPAAPLAVPTPSAYFVSAAVNAAGDVALGAADAPATFFGLGGSPLRAGLGTGGCPTALRAQDGGQITYAPAAVTAADGGFWVAGTGLGFSLSGSQGGSFVEAAHLATIGYYYEQSTALSADGARLHTMAITDLDDGGSGLVTMPVRVNRSPPNFGAPIFFFPFAVPGAFSNANCGPGCLASAMVPTDGTTNSLLVALSDDTLSLLPLGAGYYTASCGKSPNAKAVSVAYSLGLLGFLYTDATHANFYLCQKPTF